MRRLLIALALGLVGDPELIFLDEPTTGLDPRSRLELWDIIRELVGAGTYGTLTVTKATGAYTYTKNAAAIEALAGESLEPAQ